jgi:YesN/AraC family two-component response regulator
VALDCEIVGTARDGEAGKRLLLETHPDILLTDIRMPQCSGIDMLEAVRQDIPDCKVIIITGYDQFQYASRAIKLAVFDYLLKPIKNDEVIQSVRQATEEMRRRKAALESVERANAFTRQAQLMSLLTNPSQRGQGVRAMLEDLNLRFGAYYIMTIQENAEETFSQSSLNHLDRIIASHQARAVTCLL